MFKRLWAIAGFIGFVIGIGGIKGDLDAWVRWLRMENINSDIWWGLLIAVGFVLLLLGIVPHQWWTRANEHLPLLVRRLLDAMFRLRPESDKISVFYTTRTSMARSSYGGILKELESVKEKQVYAAWHGGQIVKEIAEKNQQTKIAQLILLWTEPL
jgi:hypothetical protein